MSATDLPPASAKPRRMGLYLPFVVLAIFMIVWSIVWYFASQRVNAVLDGFVAREAGRGRDWVCPDRTITGFPFRVQLNCSKPRLIEAGPSGLRREAGLAGLSIHGRITSPGHFIALLEGPLNIRLDSDRDLTVRWQSARASFRGGAANFGDLSLEIAAPEALLGLGEAKDERIIAKDLALHFRRSPGDTPGSDFLIKIADISHPAIDRLVGSPEPMTLEMQTTAPGLLLEQGKKIEDALETWRQANGRARVVVAKLTKGQAVVDLSGELGVDDQRRPQGNLQGRARGVDQILNGVTRRMGLEIGGLLGRLGGGQGMPVALVLENGRMRFGPFPLMTLTPLY
ncbi:Protein of unknown function DUF2125 [Rhabdaerophilaceae bacterium]